MGCTPDCSVCETLTPMGDNSTFLIIIFYSLVLGWEDTST